MNLLHTAVEGMLVIALAVAILQQVRLTRVVATLAEMVAGNGDVALEALEGIREQRDFHRRHEDLHRAILLSHRTLLEHNQIEVPEEVRVLLGDAP